MWFVLLSVVVMLIYTIIIFQFRTGIGRNVISVNQINPQPRISIVVALKNEALNIEPLLTSIKGLDYPKEKLELILVDDNSSDTTLRLLQSYGSDNINVFSSTGSGKKQALEMGITNATGDWIAVTDADCELPQNWLSSMVRYISNETKMVLGPVFVSRGKGFLADIQTIEFLALQGATSGSAGNNNPISANGANMLFEKKAFESVKPYESNYHLNTGDDQFLMMAVHNAFPNAIVYAQNKEAIVNTNPVNNWRKYIAQRVRWTSKGSAYSDISIKLKGAVIFMTSFLVTLSLIYGLLLGNYYLAFGFILVKMLVDLVLIVPMKHFSGRSFSILSLIGSAILYPFVVVLSVILGFLRK
jgi:cellulose synthase/poly-beta-1,6-N-acetylglucosamine synthase-like glycosyltransferase